MLTEISWNILQEQGRALKAAVDIAKLECKFVYQEYGSHFTESNRASKHNNKFEVQSIYQLRKIATKHPSLMLLFGICSKQQQLVCHFQSIHSSKFKSNLRIPLKLLFNSSEERAQLLANKRRDLLRGVEQFELFLASNRAGKFICGQNVTVVDLLFYFDICNLVYFGKNHSDYQNISEWFNHLYKIRQVRVLTHQWFSMAKEIAKLFKSIRKIQAKI